MKRRSIMLLTACVLVIVLIGTAFAAWKLDSLTNLAGQISLARDDIEENYSFTEVGNKKQLNKTYTIYLFPSALYLNDYVDYLNGETGAVKPEDKYGSVAPRTNHDGSVARDEKGNIIYDVDYSGVKNSALATKIAELSCGGDGGYIGNLIGNYNDLYLTSDNTLTYDTKYDGNYEVNQFDSEVAKKAKAYWAGTLNYISDDGNSFSVGETEKRYIGSFSGDSDSDYLVGGFKQKQYNYRNQHRYDRFGAWRELKYGEGRYLPLKISVGANFAYSDFADLILSALTSMPDGSGALLRGEINENMNLTFSNWSYVDFKTTEAGKYYKLPYYADYADKNLRVRNAFLSYMLEQYFDIMEDFERYSDEYGIIRLFPTFSCGSNRVEADAFAGEKWGEGVNNGTGDEWFMFTANSKGFSGTGMQSTMSDPMRDYRIHTTMTTHTVENYKNDVGTVKISDAETKDIRCTMYANLNITNILSYAKDKDGNIDKDKAKLEIWLNPRGGSDGAWNDSNPLLIYDISYDVLTKIVEFYGDGLYNLYLFVGNSGLSGSATTARNSISNIVNYAKGNNDIFPSLSGKNLVGLEQYGSKKLSYFGETSYDEMNMKRSVGSVNGHGTYPAATAGVNNEWSQFLGAKAIEDDSGTSSNKFYRPVMVAIEKVRDTRVLMNLDVKEMKFTGTGGVVKPKNDVKKLWEAYDKTGVSFRLLSEDIYDIDIGASKVNIGTSEEDADKATPLNDKYPYCYILSGIDFTNSATDYFQIRFQQHYRKDLPFVGTDGTAGKDVVTQTDKVSQEINSLGGGGLAPAINLIYNPSSDGSFNEDRRFVNAFGKDGYFSAVVANMENNISPTASEQVFFKLKDDNMRGIYDLIIVYVPSTLWTVISSVGAGKTHTTVCYSEDAANALENAGGKKYEHKAGFYTFAYRHTNIFLKVVEKNPTATIDGNDYFVKHNDYSDNRLVYQAMFELGVKLGPDYDNQVLSTDTETVNPVVSDYTLAKVPLGTCINRYVEAYLKENPAKDISKIVLRDHVTGGIIAYYAKTATAPSANNYIIEAGDEYWQLTFEELVIRKNYIFYFDEVV